MHGKLRFIACVPEFILMILAVTAGTSPPSPRNPVRNAG